jgi:phospholipid/cholesterol/gamma-HCH transport system substrate-binding protein
LRPGGGIVAKVDVENGVRIPDDSIVQVRSSSVIGEQYLNFLPPKTGLASTGSFESGDVVPASQTSIPTSTNDLLTSVDTLLASVPLDDLRTTVDELGQTFRSSGDDLGSVIDAGSSLVDLATANLDPTRKLIEDLDPVLATQQDLDPQIRAFASNLNSVTAQVERSDDDLRTLLASGSPLATSVAKLSTGLQGELPDMLADIATTAQVGRVYRGGIEHLLSVLPALLVDLLSAVPVTSENDPIPELRLYFKTNLATPFCTNGYADADKIRPPEDLSEAPIPADSYCKNPARDTDVIRGARNAPCPNGGRAATAAGCGLNFGQFKVSNRAETGAALDGSYDAGAAGFTTPSGQFFLLDPTAGVPVSKSLQAYLAGLVKP